MLIAAEAGRGFVIASPSRGPSLKDLGFERGRLGV